MDRSARTLAKLLDGLLHRVRRRLLFHGLATLATVGGAAVLAAAWTVGGPERPALWTLRGLAFSLAGLLVLLAVRFLWLPLGELRHRRDLVRRVERDGDHANLLVAAEESLRRPERWEGRGPAAVVLLSRLRDQARSRVAQLLPSTVAPLPDRRPLAAGLALVALVGVLLVVTAGGDLLRGAALLATPWQGPPAPATGGIYGLPTGPFAVAGDTVRLQALDLAAGDDTAVCEIRRGTGLWQPLPARLARPATGHAGRLWAARVPDVREDLSWRFRRGSIVSSARHLVVRQRPLLSALALRVEPPAYTRIPAQDLANMPGWLEVPAGSVVSLRGRTSHPVDRARLVTAADDTLVLGVDSLAVTGSLEVVRGHAFRILLEDAWGLTNAAPLRYEINAAADQAPAARLERPDDDGLLPLEGVLELAAAAEDDYGVAALALELRVRAGEVDGTPPAWRRVSLLNEPAFAWHRAGAGGAELGWRRTDDAGDNPPLRRRQRLELQLGDLQLVAGDVLELVLVALDNRWPGPPGEGRSRVLRLLAPSAADVLARHDESGEARRGELGEMRRRSRELGADLDRLSRELMKNPVPDWGRQQEMEEALRRRNRLQEELDRVAEELQRELEVLAGNQLTSERQLRQADEVADLLRQESSGRLADLMRRLEEAGERPDADDVTRALREIARNQQELVRRMDAAQSMLERMAREQDLAGMTAMLEQLIQKQQELADLSRRLAEEQSAAADSLGGHDAGETGDPEDGDPAADDESGDELAAAPESGAENEAEPGSESEAGAEPETGAVGPTPQELARRQEAVNEELERLQERLEQTLAEMRERAESGESSDAEQQRQEALQQALESMEEQMAAGRRQEASDQLQQLDPQEAARMQQEMVHDLGALYHVLLQSQQAMQMAMKMNQAVSLRGLAADLLAISSRQEEIVDQVPPRLREVRTLGLTRDQHRLRKATVNVRDELAVLASDSPMRIMKQLEKLDGLIEEMGHAVRAFEDNRAPAARSHTRRSLASANQAIIALLTEAQMASGQSGQGSSSEPSAAEQMQELVRQQAQLNGATEELRRMLANRGISQEARSQMERLGEAQARLAEETREVAEGERERPDGERILGDLGALAEDMESVAGDLDTGLADEEVLARQERILGRMLDARNSVRRRDFSSRRESRTAERVYAARPAPSGPAGADAADPNELRYQPLERAPLAYRDLVRRYFMALETLRQSDADADGGGDLP